MIESIKKLFREKILGKSKLDELLKTVEKKVNNLEKNKIVSIEEYKNSKNKTKEEPLEFLRTSVKEIDKMFKKYDNN